MVADEHAQASDECSDFGVRLQTKRTRRDYGVRASSSAHSTGLSLKRSVSRETPRRQASLDKAPEGGITRLRAGRDARGVSLPSGVLFTPLSPNGVGARTLLGSILG